MLSKFVSNQNGAIAVNFALIVVPVIMFAGIALDYTRARQAQSQLGAAVDATAIAAATMASEGIAAGELNTRAQAFFKANYPNSDATVSINASANTVTVNADKTLQTSLMSIAGIKSLDLKARAVAAKSNPVDAEIALVLDYSGSMGWGGKYQAMRDAAVEMIDTLSAAGSKTIADVKIGLVPFSEFVYADMKSTYIRDIHMDKHGANVRACLDARRAPYATQDSTPLPNTDDSKWPAPGMPDQWRLAGALPNSDVNTLDTGDKVCETTREKTSEECQQELDALYGENNYTSDQMHDCRDQTVTETTLISQSDQCQKSYTSDEKMAQTDEAMTSDFADASPQCTVYRDRNIVTTPLTSDYASLTAQLQAMTPVRLTNIALGLEMGWHLVSSNQPFIEGTQYGNKKVEKFIVLLTDGAQTVGGWGPGNTFSIAQAEQNTEALCSAIKAQGVKLITVAFDLRDQATKARLQNCATDPQYFFDAATNTDLASAFQEITAKLFVPVHLVE